MNGKVKKGVVFATYSSLIGESQGQEKYNTRMSQLLNWCGHDFDGVVSFSIFVYYKITESLFVFWFIFIVGHHSHLCLMIYKLSLYFPNIPHGISSPGNPQKLDLNYQYLISYYSTVKLLKNALINVNFKKRFNPIQDS